MPRNRHAPLKPVVSTPSGPGTIEQQAVAKWFSDNKGKYDPKALSFLQSQWNDRGVDPASFVKAYDYKDSGKGVAGWFNKTGGHIGDDYVLDSQSGQWITRNRATGQGTVEGVSNYQQGQHELGSIQAQIDTLNKENDRLQHEGRFLGVMGTGPADAVRGNEQQIADLRKRYDAITGSMNAFRIDPQVADYLKTGGIVSNDAQSLALVQQVKDLINYQPGAIPENASSQAVIDAYVESLKKPFQSATENTMSDLAKRGMIGSGNQQEQIGGLQSAYDQAKKAETGNLSSDFFKNKSAEMESAFTQKVNEYIQGEQDKFKASGQTADEYYGVNNARIGADLKNIATQYQNDYQDIAAQYGQNINSFNDTMSATSNLFNSIGSVAGNYLSKSNASVPMSEALMQPATPNVGWNAVKNNAANAFSNPFTTGSSSPWGEWGK